MMPLRDQVTIGDEARATSIPRLLFATLGAPAAWSLHLLGVYFLVTLDCITAWNGSGWSVLLVTVLFAAMGAAAGWSAWRLWAGIPDDAPHAWIRFLGLLGMAASPLFTAAIVLAGAAPIFVATCG